MKNWKQKSIAKIYLDYASLTPTDKRVSAVVADYEKAEREGKYGNPSSIYAAGVAAKKALEQARTVCAQSIHTHSDEIIFTGGGTEANNLAILGVVEATRKNYKDIHIIVSAIEHTSVMETVFALQKKGVHLDILPVKQNGVVDLEILKRLLRPTTVLVSVMMVNNEIGTIQPIADIVKIVRDFRKLNSRNFPLIHTDACQALLYMDINLEKLGVDLLSADSNKIYGPRSVGMLYVRRSAATLIEPISFGGGQEKGLRAGTENVAGIVGFAKAIEIAAAERESEVARLTVLRDYCIKKLHTNIPNLTVNGDPIEHIANNINVSILHIDHEFLVLELDVRGISCSTKSACLRDSDESYVLKALHADAHDQSAPQQASQSLRISLGRFTSKKDIDYLIKTLTRLVIRDYN